MCCSLYKFSWEPAALLKLVSLQFTYMFFKTNDVKMKPIFSLTVTFP